MWTGHSICPKRFAQQISVARHERTHTGAKPYVCSMCAKRFRHQSSVAPLVRTHTGEKPYGCSRGLLDMREAVQAPEQRAPLVRIHTGEKPYGCSMCPKRFAQQSSVARHERTRTA